MDTKPLKLIIESEPEDLAELLEHYARERVTQAGENPDKLYAISALELQMIVLRHKLQHRLAEMDHEAHNEITDEIFNRPPVKENTIEVKAKRELSKGAKDTIEKLLKEMGGKA